MTGASFPNPDQGRPGDETSSFRNAIWQVLHETWADDEPLPMHADAILDMPEMQAIRLALHMAWAERGLPIDVLLDHHVAEWVRSKP